MTPSASPEPAGVRQVVHVENGFGYGCVGADIHVFGDGRPVYLLFGHRPAADARSPWLRAQPSRMLDARAEVVGFTGRAAESAELAAWRDADARFAVRWLHGEGGQGKTRLANRLAAESRRAGWKVVSAVHGTDAHPPAEGSQDLRPDGHEGVLLLVDYADRWPLSDLSWLFHNRLLRRPVPVRVLLIGRSASGWPALRGKLDQLREGIDTSDLYLAPLPDDGSARDRMFTAARDCFAVHYPDVTDPRAIAPPGPLSTPGFGLTLVVHMAALVAVDAAARGRRPPGDVVGLTVYLLDREHENWRQLYENSGHGLDFRTSDAVMARAVFAAILAGPADRQAALGVLELLMPRAPAERILLDHAVCYPPTDPGRANTLEPLLPDRLAEDFLALMLPGSPVSGHPTDAWAAAVPAALLRRGEDGAAPPWAPRTLAYLAAAADRWPHVGDGHLYPVVRADPRLVLDAGSAALTALARIGEGELADGDLLGVLESIDTVLPGLRHVDLDPGIASVAERLTARRLADADDHGDQAVLLSRLATRYDHAGLVGKAVASADESARIFRRLAAVDPDANLAGLGGTLTHLGGYLSARGRHAEALATAEEAAGIFRQLVASDPARHLPGLSGALVNLGSLLSAQGEQERALRVTLEATAILMRLADTDPAAHLFPLATTLDNLGRVFSDLGRPEDSLKASEQAVTLFRLIAERNSAACLPDLARALHHRGHWLSQLGRPEEALRAVREAVAIDRRLVASNPGAHQAHLAASLDNLGASLIGTERPDEAVPAFEEAVALFRHLAEADPGSREPDLAKALGNLGAGYARLGRLDEAVSALREGTGIGRRLAAADPRAHLLDHARAVDNLVVLLTALDLPEVLPALQEAVAARRRLAETDPGAHRAELAKALAGMAGRRAADPGGLPHARAALEEAAFLLLDLAAREPRTYAQDLRGVLVGYAAVLGRLGLTARADGIRQVLTTAATLQDVHHALVGPAGPASGS